MYESDNSAVHHCPQRSTGVAGSGRVAFRLFINLGRRHVWHLLCAEFTGTGCQVCFMKVLTVLRKTYFDRRSLMFHAAQIDFTFVQMNQFPYKHESDTTSGYFRVDRIASRKCILNNFFCSWRVFRYLYRLPLHSNCHWSPKHKYVRYRSPVYISRHSR